MSFLYDTQGNIVINFGYIVRIIFSKISTYFGLFGHCMITIDAGSVEDIHWSYLKL